MGRRAYAIIAVALAALSVAAILVGYTTASREAEQIAKAMIVGDRAGLSALDVSAPDQADMANAIVPRAEQADARPEAVLIAVHPRAASVDFVIRFRSRTGSVYPGRMVETLELSERGWTLSSWGGSPYGSNLDPQ